MYLRRAGLMPRPTTGSSATISTRALSTKGHKKTRRIEARQLEIQKQTKPKLPWYFQTTPPKRLTRFFADRDNLIAIKENAELIYKLLREQPVRTPLGAVLNRLKSKRLAAERERWEEKQLPVLKKKVRGALAAISPPPTSAVPVVEASLEQIDLGQLETSTTPTVTPEKSDVIPVLSSVEDPEAHAKIKAQVDEELSDDIRMQVAKEEQQDLVDIKVREVLEIQWIKELERRRTEPSDGLVKRLEWYNQHSKAPPAELGVRLIKAYERENNMSLAWKTFLEFTGKRSLWTPSLVEAGIVLCERRKKPERALNLFELAEIQFGRAAIPQFYHPTMKACASQRGTTQYTFDIYDRMTKVDFLQPTPETLAIVLKACSTLGDVERAEQFWQEMVVSGDVVPTEDCVVGMLNCYANGNRMLRAKTLKKSSIKVLTFEDKARLALAGGFTPPKVDQTDEAGELIRELDGLDPREMAARYSMEQEDDWDAEDDDHEEFDDDEEEDPEVLQARKEFDEEEANELKTATEAAAEQQSTEHVTVIPGISPASLPPITHANYQKTFEVLARLGAADVNNEKKDAKDASVVERNDSSSGRRQETNIARSKAIVAESTERFQVEVTPRILNAQLRVFAEALRLHRASQFLQEFEEHGLMPDVMTFSVLIDMFSRAQRVERAKEMFELAKQAGAVDKLTVGPLVDALARNGQVDEAFQLYKQHEGAQLLERHMRFLRLKLKGDPRAEEFPADPNAWRSRENIARQLRAVGRDPSARKTQSWLQSVARS